MISTMALIDNSILNLLIGRLEQAVGHFISIKMVWEVSERQLLLKITAPFFCTKSEQIKAMTVFPSELMNNKTLIWPQDWC